MRDSDLALVGHRRIRVWLKSVQPFRLQVEIVSGQTNPQTENQTEERTENKADLEIDLATDKQTHRNTEQE
jgi:hypothetical protein